MRKNLWDKLDEFPPIICRLLARTSDIHGGVRPLTESEIAQRSGLAPNEVKAMSWLVSWDDVPLKKIKAFIEGCNLDLTDRHIYRTQTSYIRRGATWTYLRNSEDWLSVYQPMIHAYIDASRNKSE